MKDNSRKRKNGIEFQSTQTKRKTLTKKKRSQTLEKKDQARTREMHIEYPMQKTLIKSKKCYPK